MILMSYLSKLSSNVLYCAISHFQATCTAGITVLSLSIFYADCIDPICFKSLAFQGRNFTQGEGNFSAASLLLIYFSISLSLPHPSILLFVLDGS